MEALKEVDGSRKCFRLVGGVLVERTVNEVLPALTTNYDQVGPGWHRFNITCRGLQLGGKKTFYSTEILFVQYLEPLRKMGKCKQCVPRVFSCQFLDKIYIQQF